MPNIAARSDDSDEARMAMPTRVSRRNRISAAVTIGTTMMISKCPPLKINGDHVHLKWNGCGGCGTVL
jgi:hypothetical protein